MSEISPSLLQQLSQNRSREMAAIETALSNQGAALLVPREGVGAGIGTSCLASACVTRVQSRMGRVLRLRASHELIWQSDLVRTCARLKLSECHVSRPEIPLLGFRYWLHKQKEPLVLWIDDITERVDIVPLIDVWSTLRRQGRHSLRLILSAREPAIQLKAISQPIQVRGIERAVAVSWLLHSLEKNHFTLGESDDAATICEFLGRHPEAIRLAGNLLRVSAVSLEEFLTRLQKFQRESQRELSLEQQTPLHLAVHGILSFLGEICPQARSLLARLCCLAGHTPTDEELRSQPDHEMVVGWPAREMTAWPMLQELGLVSHRADVPRLACDTLRRVTRELLPEQIISDSAVAMLPWGQRMIEPVSGSGTWMSSDVERLQAVWPLIECLLPHVGTSPKVDSFLRSAAFLFHQLGACQTAEEIYDRLIETRVPSTTELTDGTASHTGRLSPQDARLVGLMEERGNTRMRQQKHLLARKDFRTGYEILRTCQSAESETGLRLSLSIVETDLSECRLKRAATRMIGAERILSKITVSTPGERTRYLMLRGALKLAAGHAASAHKLLQGALHQVQRTEPEDSPQAARIRILLSKAAFALKKFDDAEVVLRDDLDIRERASHIGVVESLVPMVLLADLYVTQGRYIEADPLLRHIVEVRRSCFGARHRLTGEAAGKLAVLLSARGDFRSAEPLFREALVVEEEAFGENHPQVARLLNDLVESLFAQGKYAAAQRMLERALRIQQRSLEPTDLQLSRTHHNLAALAVARGQFGRAERHYRYDLQVKRLILPPCHPSIAQTLNNLGDVLRSLARFDEALVCLTEALDLRRESWGEQHPLVAQSLNNLGYLRLQQRQYQQARALFVKALQIREQTLSPEHPHIAATCEVLADTLVQLGDIEEALHYYQRALSICEEVYGERNPHTAFVMTRLGRAEILISRRARAELHLRKAEQTLHATVGANHRYVAEALWGRAELLAQECRWSDAFSFLERALSIFRETMAGSRLVVSDVLFAMAENLAQRGLNQEAIDRLEECLRIRLESLDEEHLHIAQVRLRLAGLLISCGNLPRAERLLQAAWPVMAREDVPLGPWYFEALTRQADLEVAANRLEEAETILSQQLSILDEDPRHQPQQRVRLLSRIAGVHHLQKRFESMVPLIQECLSCLSEEYGPNHPAMVPYLDHLANVQLQLGRHSEAERLIQQAVEILQCEHGEDHPAVIELLKNYAAMLHACSQDHQARQIEHRIHRLKQRSPHVLDELM